MNALPPLLILTFKKKPSSNYGELFVEYYVCICSFLFKDGLVLTNEQLTYLYNKLGFGRCAHVQVQCTFIRLYTLNLGLQCTYVLCDKVSPYILRGGEWFKKNPIVNPIIGKSKVDKSILNILITCNNRC